MFVNIPSIKVGDEIKEDTFNDFISEVTQVPSNINEDNVRIEGIDRRNIKITSIQETREVWEYKSDNLHNLSLGHLAKVTESGNSNKYIRAPQGATTVTCKNGEFIIVYFSAEFEVRHGGHDKSAKKGGTEFEIRLIYEDTQTGHPTNDIPGTTRIYNSFLVTDNDDLSPHLRGCCTIVAAFQTKTTSSGNNEIFVLPFARAMYAKPSGRSGTLIFANSNALGTPRATLKNIYMNVKVVRR